MRHLYRLGAVALSLLAFVPAEAAISFVGSNGAVVSSGSGNTTVALPTVLENDIVFVSVACDNDLSADGLSAGQGYTDIYHGTSALPGHHLAWKIMGATPDTTVTIERQSARSSAVLIQAFRGVDTATPLDATTTSASGGSGDPDSPSITTVTNAAWVITIGLVDDDAPITVTTVPSGYSNSNSQDTVIGGTTGAAVVMASKNVASFGAEDPAAWVLSSNDNWFAYSVAIRPDSGGGGGRTRRMF